MPRDAPRPHVALQSAGAGGRRLRVRFSPHKDRYSHQIDYLDGRGPAVELMQTVEGSEGDSCPPSPALQALNTDDLGAPDDPAESPALLIGVAGDSHWSVSIAPGPPTQGPPTQGSTTRGGPTVAYDGACRLKRLVAELRATYRTPGARIIDRGPQVVVLCTGGVRWRVVVDRAMDSARPGFCRISLPTGIGWAIQPKIAVVCEPAMTDEPPVTLPCRFRVEVL